MFFLCFFKRTKLIVCFNGIRLMHSIISSSLLRSLHSLDTTKFANFIDAFSRAVFSCCCLTTDGQVDLLFSVFFFFFLFFCFVGKREHFRFLMNVQMRFRLNECNGLFLLLYFTMHLSLSTIIIFVCFESTAAHDLTTSRFFFYIKHVDGGVVFRFLLSISLLLFFFLFRLHSLVYFFFLFMTNIPNGVSLDGEIQKPI